MIKSLLLVGLGGASGSILRYLLQKAVNTALFPYGTLLINITGCFLIGLLWGLPGKDESKEAARLLLITGFCGGFTTFSAFTAESMQLANEAKWFYFFMYIAASVCGGLLATFFGYKITN